MHIILLRNLSNFTRHFPLMKTVRTILFITLLPMGLLGQDKKLTIDITGSPSFYKIKSEKGFNYEYTSRLGSISGLNFSFCFSKRSTVAVGLYYLTLGYKIDYNYTFIQQGDPAIPRERTVSAKYLDIPVKYNFKMIANPKLELYLSGGIVYSVLIASDDKTTFENNSTVSSVDKDLNSSLLNLQVGVGLQYNLTERVGVKLEPHYRLFAKGIDKIMYQHPTSIDGTVGVVFTLWKKN